MFQSQSDEKKPICQFKVLETAANILEAMTSPSVCAHVTLKSYWFMVQVRFTESKVVLRCFWHWLRFAFAQFFKFSSSRMQEMLISIVSIFSGHGKSTDYLFSQYFESTLSKRVTSRPFSTNLSLSLHLTISIVNAHKFSPLSPRFSNRNLHYTRSLRTT